MTDTDVCLCGATPTDRVDLARWSVYEPADDWRKNISLPDGMGLAACQACSPLIEARDIAGLIARIPDAATLGEHGVWFIEQMVNALPEPVSYFDYWADQRQSAVVDGEATESPDPATDTRKPRRPWRSATRGRRGGGRGRRG